ncbi:outer membrane lipoprotein chaperone LolA [Salinimonas chungwhensis]|uniref:outer membrane lipoprotein chaperone LolA n=1 Tax=Salinimonas chungwhensis TaxID=265425 RepID=UPI000380A7A0|nr:outer membrane lipoprotein chaperone LolA [Salinimonas chungwhensis]
MKSTMKLLLTGLAVSWMALSYNVLASDKEDVKSALQSKLDTMQQYKADFTQTVKDMDGTVIHEASGALTMARPDKLRWETKRPDQTLLIADGRAVWNVDTFVEQVTIIDQTSAIQDNPIVLLTTDDEKQWAEFTIQKMSDSAYSITPVDGTGQIQALHLYFDGDILSRLIMKDAQGQTSVLEFNHIQTKFEPALSQFEVTIPDTYTIDDQR